MFSTTKYTWEEKMSKIISMWMKNVLVFSAFKSYYNIHDIQLLEIKPQWRKLQSMARPHLIDSFYGPTKLVKAWESLQILNSISFSSLLYKDIEITFAKNVVFITKLFLLKQKI